jgi:phosphoglycerate dehydrogenase-like enzyme
MIEPRHRVFQMGTTVSDEYDDQVLDVVIATPLDAELAATIAERAGVRVHYEPDLLPPARYPSDHRGVPDFARSPADEKRWQQLLTDAEVLYGFPGDTPDGLAAVVHGCPRLRFVQGTAAGTGEQVDAAGLTDADLERVAVTTAVGVHGGPLAEFAILGLLAFTRDLRRIQEDQAARRWPHYAIDDLDGRRIVVLGTGVIGAQVARVAKALGMDTVGVNRSGGTPTEPFDELHDPADLSRLVAGAHALVVTVPLTEQSRGMVDAKVLDSLADDAVVVNVGRGAVIDESALIEALESGRLAGAALDVTTTEPLPDDSPLWTLPNVLLSPHTAALSPLENQRIVDIFIDNLARLRDGRELRNRVTSSRRY